MKAWLRPGFIWPGVSTDSLSGLGFGGGGALELPPLHAPSAIGKTILIAARVARRTGLDAPGFICLSLLFRTVGQRISMAQVAGGKRVRKQGSGRCQPL